ncbi:unnamed protein product [marine sediment metagenome]|uniref:Uncharacterized protein n=1 Tax=marine sediment metagenome TaxID=412755 RepID=X0TKD8_9ZZZZ
MVTEITKNEVAELYLAQLQSEAARLSAVDREIKRYIVTDPVTRRMVTLSITDLITEVQNRTQVGMLKAIAYVQELKDAKDEQLYIITG